MTSDDTTPRLEIGRRRFLQYSGLVSAGVLASGALAACGSTSDGTAVRLTTGLSVDQAPTIVGAAEGLFDANGITAQLRTFSVANDGAQAQLSGQADTSTLVELPLVSYAAKGTKLVSVAVIVLAGTLSMVAVNSIKSPADLRGKKVGYPFGTGQEYGFVQYVQKYGLSPSDVEPANVANADLPAVLVRGDIDAFIGTEPGVTKAINLMKGRAHRLDPSPSTAYLTRNHLVVDRDWAKANTSTVTALIKNYIKADEHIKAHLDASAATVAEALKITSDQVKALWKQNNDRWNPHFDEGAVTALQGVAQFALDRKIIKQMPDISSLYDTSYLKSVDPSSLSI